MISVSNAIRQHCLWITLILREILRGLVWPPSADVHSPAVQNRSLAIDPSLVASLLLLRARALVISILTADLRWRGGDYNTVTRLLTSGAWLG